MLYCLAAINQLLERINTYMQMGLSKILCYSGVAAGGLHSLRHHRLIAHQQECGLPVTTKSGAILKRSVPRETWELNNDDVELVEKIGSVSFFNIFNDKL